MGNKRQNQYDPHSAEVYQILLGRIAYRTLVFLLTPPKSQLVRGGQTKRIVTFISMIDFMKNLNSMFIDKLFNNLLDELLK